MKKTISNKIHSQFKYRYQSAPETIRAYELVQKLTKGKWVDKAEMLETLRDYIFHNEAEMLRFIEISVLAHINAEGIRMMLDQWEKNNSLEADAIDREIKKLETKLKLEGKL